MGVSAALGIKGYKQFQLSLIIFFTAESKDLKKKPQIHNWKQLFVHIKHTLK